MREKTRDIWQFEDECDYLCVTTNGYVNKEGKAVMGRGVAKEAMERYPGIENLLGLRLKNRGNHVFSLINLGRTNICSFPVKHHWKDKANLRLIERSCIELAYMLSQRPDAMRCKVVLPRPGCGNGGLEWDAVKPILEDYFDKRFIVLDKPDTVEDRPPGKNEWVEKTESGAVIRGVGWEPKKRHKKTSKKAKTKKRRRKP